MTRRKSATLAITLALTLLLAGCAEKTPSTDDESSQTTESSSGDGELTVSVTAEGIEIPDEITGGAIEVTLQSGEDVTFSKVAAGTTEAQFKEAITQTVQGGPIPDFVEAQTGTTVTPAGAKSTVILAAGEYIVWAEKPQSEEEEESGAAAEIFTKSLTVTAGESEELPDTGGNVITARDYTFDVKLTSGAREFQFRNDGPDQFHHVVLFNFGDLDRAVVEENLPDFFAAGEDAPLKPPFDKLNHDELFPGGSAVLSPGQAATATAEIKGGGSTYAAACFITDKTGGPPHATAKGMFTVFTVE